MHKKSVKIHKYKQKSILWLINRFKLINLTEILMNREIEFR